MTKAITDRISEVRADFKSKEEEFPREAAELAYVLARLYREAGKPELAEKYAGKSVSLFEALGVNTLEDAASRYTVVADVCLPSYIHQDVVRHAFPEFRL